MSSLSCEDVNCYFKVFYSNGSRSWCLDEECCNHLDIISLESVQCRTNYLSLRFSSYKSYSKFLVSSWSQLDISSYFSVGRPNIERLLQIEFLSPFENSSPFELDELNLLSNSVSNIDTYELVFSGRIAQDNIKLFIDEDMFLSAKQQFIDTLRLIFNCSENERVEWELIKSISSLPPSPCPEQIQFLKKDFLNNENSFERLVLVSFLISFFQIQIKFFIFQTSGISFVCIIIVVILSLVLYSYSTDHHRQSMSNSRMLLWFFVK